MIDVAALSVVIKELFSRIDLDFDSRLAHLPRDPGAPLRPTGYRADVALPIEWQEVRALADGESSAFQRLLQRMREEGHAIAAKASTEMLRRLEDRPSPLPTLLLASRPVFLVGGGDPPELGVFRRVQAHDDAEIRLATYCDLRWPEEA